jgi:hypothetical protein
VSSTIVALCYGSALLLALVLLWHFGAKHWYWHVLSVAAALAIGFVPVPSLLNTPQGTLCVGWVFTLLLIWGIAAPAFEWRDHHLGIHHRTH